MAATAAEVPGKYDVVIDGTGFMYANTESVQAEFGYSPVFVARTNVDGDFGDNQQEFWLTIAQRDWSLGERQKFFRQEGDRTRRYWQSEAVDVRTPGQVTMRQAVRTLTAAAAATAVTQVDNSTVAFVTSTNLYYVDHTGTITDQGAHGLGTTPTSIIAVEGAELYMTSEAAGTVGIRKYSSGVFSTFSGTAAVELAYLNNTLFGVSDAGALLRRWDTAGTATTLYIWQQPDAGIRAWNLGKAAAFGGRLLLLLNYASGCELWLYDGTAPQIIAKMPANFYGVNITVAHGIAFIGGTFIIKDDNTNRTDRPGIYFYANGVNDVLWQSDDPVTVTTATALAVRAPAVTPFDGGIVFTDDATGRFMFYELASGGVHSIGSYTTPSSGSHYLAACSRHFVYTRNSTTAYQYPNASSFATTSTVTTSLADFNSSLDKYFKAVVVDCDISAGSTVDVAYRLNDLDGAFTTIQAGIASGTEYAINQAGRSIAIKVTMNKGSATTSPKIKRIYVRGIVKQGVFRRQTYVLGCGGRDGQHHSQLVDGTFHPLDGLAQAIALRASITGSAPFTVTDEFGTYTAVAEAERTSIRRVGNQEYIVTVTLRSV